MEIKSLGNTGFGRIYEAFSRAFAVYEIQQNRERLRAMLRRRGFDRGLSYAAFDGDAIAALLLGEILRLNRNDSVKVVNTEVQCSPITCFLEAKNMELKGKQFEMTRKL